MTRTRPEPAPAPCRPAERVLTRRCRHCGAEYEPSRAHQAFCRPSCRVGHFKAGAASERPESATSPALVGLDGRRALPDRVLVDVHAGDVIAIFPFE
jgi:hypothetical protein